MSLAEDGIPAFLRVENRRGTAAPRKETKVAEAPSEEAIEDSPLLQKLTTEARKLFLENVRRGRARLHWLEDDSVAAHWQEKLVVAEAKRAANKERLAELRARAPKKVSPLRGLIKLKQILREMGNEAPRRRHAIAAIDAAKLEHLRYHFPNAPVTLARVKQVIRDYVPPVSSRGSKKPEFDAALHIKFSGDNPKKPGSSAHARWELLIKHSGKTVGDFLAAGGNPVTLKNALDRKSAALEKQCSSPVSAKKAKKARSPRGRR